MKRLYPVDGIAVDSAPGIVTVDCSVEAVGVPSMFEGVAETSLLGELVGFSSMITLEPFSPPKSVDEVPCKGGTLDRSSGEVMEAFSSTTLLVLSVGGTLVLDSSAGVLVLPNGSFVGSSIGAEAGILAVLELPVVSAGAILLLFSSTLWAGLASGGMTGSSLGAATEVSAGAAFPIESIGGAPAVAPSGALYAGFAGVAVAAPPLGSWPELLPLPGITEMGPWSRFSLLAAAVSAAVQARSLVEIWLGFGSDLASVAGIWSVDEVVCTVESIDDAGNYSLVMAVGAKGISVSCVVEADGICARLLDMAFGALGWSFSGAAAFSLRLPVGCSLD